MGPIPKTHFCFFTTSCDRKNRFKSFCKTIQDVDDDDVNYDDDDFYISINLETRSEGERKKRKISKRKQNLGQNFVFPHFLMPWRRGSVVTSRLARYSGVGSNHSDAFRFKLRQLLEFSAQDKIFPTSRLRIWNKPTPQWDSNPSSPNLEAE